MNAILMVDSHRPRRCIVNGKEIGELFTLEDFHGSNVGFIYDSSQGKVCIKPGVERALIVLEYSEGRHWEGVDVHYFFSDGSKPISAG